MRMHYAVMALATAFVVAPAAWSAPTTPTIDQCLSANERSIAARNNLALREAQRALATCASDACPAEIRRECNRRLGEVVAALPSIVFAPTSERGEDLDDVRVEMDGKPLTDHLGAAALPVDPGTHVFVFVSPGRPSVQKTFIVREGEKDRHESITFERAAIAPLLTLPARHKNIAWRVTGGTLAGVGLVGLVASAIFGGFAANAFSAQQRDCRSTLDCIDRKTANTDHDRTIAMATASTVAFIGGGVLVGVGGALFFAAPSVDASGRGAALAIGGVF